MPDRKFSEDFLKDPTRTKRLIGEYLEDMIALFEDFRAAIIKDFERAAAGKKMQRVQKAISVKPEEFFPHIDTLLQKKILVPGDKIIDTHIPRAYIQGDRFAGIMLGASKETRRTEWKKIGKVLIEKNRADLKGIADETAKQIRSTIADGILNEAPMKDISREIVRKVDSVGIVRATAMVKTETMTAVNTGVIDRYKRTDVSKVRRLEADDEKTCDECAAHDGEIYAIEDASGVLPAHPGCRGTWVPVVDVGGEAE
ncbi:MAG: minor capsid protein [Victivallaceae bacterium]|nr:minor capsid protein [Victivallaceae bacterium]